MLYFIGIIVLILTYVLFSNFILGYKKDKKYNPIIVSRSETINILRNSPYSGSKITRSEDKKTGIEFSYTTWMNIDDTLDDTKYQNIFLKGGVTNDSLNPAQCPGVWVKKNLGASVGKSVDDIKLIINFDTFLVKDNETICDNLDGDCAIHDYCDTNGEYEGECVKRNQSKSKCETVRECKWTEPVEGVDGNEGVAGHCNSACSNKSKETIELNNIPFKRWFHLAIIVRNKEVDVYINGNLYDTFKLKGVIKQNNNELLFGFGANQLYPPLNTTIISDFRYFNYAIPYYRLDNLLKNSKSDLKVPIRQNTEFKPYLNRKYWTRENSDLDIYNKTI